MTPEEPEKLAREIVSRGIAAALVTTYHASAYQIAQGYLQVRAEHAALSAKLQDAEKRLGELEEDVRRRSKLFNEWDENLEEAKAKLQEAEKHLRDVNKLLEAADERQAAMRRQLQEVQAERDALSSKIAAYVSHFNSGEACDKEFEALMILVEPPASRGEVVKACPSCGKHEDGQLVFTAKSGAFYADCCCNGPVEPALWQRVGGQP